MRVLSLYGCELSEKSERSNASQQLKLERLLLL
jgi:hypothetical protein